MRVYALGNVASQSADHELAALSFPAELAEVDAVDAAGEATRPSLAIEFADTAASREYAGRALV